MTDRGTPGTLLALLLAACGSAAGDAIASPGDAPLTPPAEVRAQPRGATEVLVSWSDPGAGAARLQVGRRLVRRCADNYVRAGPEPAAACTAEDTVWHEMATLGTTDRSWTDAAALPNREHGYRVSACAAGAGAACVTSATSSATTFAAVTGRVSTADGAALPELVATVRAGDGRSASAPVAADGTFHVALAFAAPGWSEVEVAAPDPGSGPYFPALFRLEALELASDLRVLLVPRTWTVERGAYAGRRVPISLDAAFDAPVAVGSFYQAAPTAERYGALLYAWGAPFPLPLYFDRAASDRTIDAADSVAWWNGVARLEQVMGRDLFRPAVGPAGGPSVAVRLDRTLSKSGVGTPFTRQPPERRLQEVAGWHGNVEPVATLVTLGVDSARVTIQSRALLANTFLAGHELIHVFGIGHGCSWPSIMVECAGSNHQPRTDEPTAADVAYLELLWALLAHRSDGDAWTEASVLAALAGERVVLKHEAPFHDPLPACWPNC